MNSIVTAEDWGRLEPYLRESFEIPTSVKIGGQGAVQRHGKAKHSPTNDWDTNAVWVDARRAVTVTQERRTEPQDKTLSQRGCHTS